MKWIVIEQIEVEDEGRKIEKMSGRAGRRSRNDDIMLTVYSKTVL